MRKPKKIEVRPDHWGDAASKVERYLDRAADDAWCEVWFANNFGYRAGNPKSVFPEDHPCLTVRGKKEQISSKSSKVSKKSKKRRGTKTPDLRASTDSKSASAPTTAVSTTSLKESAEETATADNSHSLEDDWLSRL